MADYTLSAKGTYDGSNFDKGISGSSSALDSFTQKCGSVGSKVTSGLSKVASVGAKVTGVFAGLATGAFMKGGIDRSLNIEQAQFKLGQLGMDVQSVMASASTAVDGTAFSLASAATSASLMGASGVQAGDQMTKALQAATGIAAIGGVEMERVSQVFSKVAAKGKVQGEELMQLSEMGVNATGALATSLGKTQAEVTKMVSAGEVDFQTFSDAMYATFGEAAYGANATFSGAMSNVRAALSRVSAKFADPALQALKGVFIALIPAINAISKALDPVVAVFAEFVDGVAARAVSVIQTFADAISDGNGIVSAFGAVIEKTFGSTKIWSIFESFSSAVKGFFGAVRNGTSPVALLANYLKALGVPQGATDAFKDFGNAVLSIISPITSGIGSFIETFKDALASGETAASAFRMSLYEVFDGTAFQFIADALEKPFATIPERMATLADSFKSHFGSIATQGLAFVGVFGGIMALFGGHITKAVTAVGGVGKVISRLKEGFVVLQSAFMTAGGGLKGITALLGAFFNPIGLVVAGVAALAAAFVYLMTTNEGFRSTIMGLVGDIGASLAPIIQVVATSLTGLASSVLPMLSTMIGMLLPVIAQIIVVVMQIVAALAPIIAVLVSTLIPIITEIIELVVMVAAQVLAAVLPVVSMILSAIQMAMPVIQSIIEAVMGVILSIITTVWPVVQEIITVAMDVIRGIIETVWPVMQDIIETVMGAIQNVISIVTAAINGDWEGVWNGIKKFFSDIWDGIKKAAQDGIDAAYNVVTGFKDKILDFFGGAGRWLSDSGKAIVQGLADGIWDAVGTVTGAIEDVLGAVRNFLPFSPAKEGPFSGKGWTLYSGQSISEALGRGVEMRGGKAVRAMSAVMGDMAETVFAAPDFSYAGGYSYNACASRAAGSSEEIDNRQSNVTINVKVNGENNDALAIASGIYDLEQRAARRWSS